MGQRFGIRRASVFATGLLLLVAAGGLGAQESNVPAEEALAADSAVSMPADLPAMREGMVVGIDELPTDDLGRPILDGFPGVIPQREVSRRARREIEPLIEEAERVLASGRAARGRVEIGELPGDAGAPARMDSTDNDPDRLRPESQPPIPTL